MLDNVNKIMPNCNLTQLQGFSTPPLAQGFAPYKALCTYLVRMWKIIHTELSGSSGDLTCRILLECNFSDVAVSFFVSKVKLKGSKSICQKGLSETLISLYTAWTRSTTETAHNKALANANHPEKQLLSHSFACNEHAQFVYEPNVQSVGTHYLPIP